MTSPECQKPDIVLVNPQMGENIGAAARAMLNCGLENLHIVNPRDGWPNERADAMSSGALEKMPPVGVHDTLGNALSGYHYVYATTARLREMEKPVLDARDAANDMKRRIADGQKIAILFGGERAGLSNDDVALAHCIVNVPLNPEFSSLNLGQAVLLVAYEWSQAVLPDERRHDGEDHLPAPHDKLVELFERFEDELQSHHFFRNDDMKPTMVRNLRTMLSRAEMTEQEVRTFHGVISALIGNKAPLEDK